MREGIAAMAGVRTPHEVSVRSLLVHQIHADHQRGTLQVIEQTNGMSPAPSHPIECNRHRSDGNLARYVYLGDAMTDPTLVNQPCDPVRRLSDGKCIVSTKFASALVRFADGSERVVKRRRLRIARSEAA